jgi:hypothetical protein
MLKDNKPIVNIPNHKKGSIINKLIIFLEDTLLIFQQENIGKIDVAEEILNERLGKILNYFSKQLPFIFQQETIQKQDKGQNRKVDIGVFCHYADNLPFYTIEAKRLTTTFQKDREKEYVLGSNPKKLTGGIERFKHNVHGVNLVQSALVAYVQRKDNKHWFVKINEWINEIIGKNTKQIIWNTKDLLINICGFKDLKIAKFLSTNNKIDESNISINHYFVNLNT